MGFQGNSWEVFVRDFVVSSAEANSSELIRLIQILFINIEFINILFINNYFFSRLIRNDIGSAICYRGEN